MRIIIALGSTSRIKSDATREACRSLGISATIVPCGHPSGVAAQPVGQEETLRGARYRARAALGTPNTWGIGIENGIVRVDGRWYDVAAVVVVTPGPDSRAITRWSEMIAIPDGYVARAEAAGFDRKTVGDVIADSIGSSPDDPHSVLTAGRLTRASILKAAIADALAEALSETTKAAEEMKTMHRITIGGVSRELPIREVAPGVRVALFNILGDWELVEAAGIALAERLPEGVDALAMPDGKATALLHVLGRASGLPTYVARKEKKPYMAEPVRSYAYRSITTNREQALHLGAEDAAALAGRRVVIVDDVISTGGTIVAMKALLAEIGAEIVAVAAVLTEGERRPDVIALEHLPLF